MDLALLEKMVKRLEDTPDGRLRKLELEQLKALSELIKEYDCEAKRQEHEKFIILSKFFDMLIKLPRNKTLEEKD